MKKYSVVFSVFALLSIMSAAEANAAEAMGLTSLLSYAKLMFQPLLSLVIVVMMIYGVFWAYTKINRYNLKKFSNHSEKILELSRLSLISHLSLGQNKSVNVVEVNNKYLVLGVTADNISLLKEFDESEMDFSNEPETPYTIIENDSDSDIEDKYSDAEVASSNTEDSTIDEICKKYLRGEYDKKVS